MSQSRTQTPIEKRTVRDVLTSRFPDENTPLSGTESQHEIVSYALANPDATIESAAPDMGYSIQWVASVLKRADESFVDETSERTERTRRQRGAEMAEVHVPGEPETVYIVPIDHLADVADRIERQHRRR